MVQRPDVAAINLLYLIPQLRQRLASRSAELTRHGMAFLVHRHGAFAFARHPDEAFDNLHRVEASARTAIYRTVLNSSSAPADNRIEPATESAIGA